MNTLEARASQRSHDSVELVKMFANTRIDWAGKREDLARERLGGQSTEAHIFR